MAKRKPKKPGQSTQEQQQPYDNILKLLLEQQETAMLPHFLSDVEFLEVLDIEVLRPPLRVDRVYKVRYRGKIHILHLEFESGSNSKMASRLLIYNAHLLDKFELPVISIIIYPFETTMAESPLRMTSGQQELLTFHFRVIALWKLEAQRFLDAHAVSIYGLLPTMQGANLQVLIQAIKEMEAYYTGNDTRLRRELLCFRVLLQRAETVPLEDKRQLEERLKMYNNLFEEDPYIQQKKAEGEAEALQRAVVTIVRVRFPPLTELAQQKVTRITKPDKLDLLLEQVAAAPDEATARWLFSTLAA